MKRWFYKKSFILREFIANPEKYCAANCTIGEQPASFFVTPCTKLLIQQNGKQPAYKPGELIKRRQCTRGNPHRR